MGKLVFGKNGQVRFYSEEELREAVEYILTSSNVNYSIHENNQKQGAWGPEDRIHFLKEEGVPECLKRNMTAGNGHIWGRINCKEFCEFIRKKVSK